MTTKPKAQATEDEQPVEDAVGRPADEAAAPEPKAEQAPACGAPHQLPALAHVTCQLPAEDPDREPGMPGHEHRHEDGDAVYMWT